MGAGSFHLFNRLDRKIVDQQNLRFPLPKVLLINKIVGFCYKGYCGPGSPAFSITTSGCTADCSPRPVQQQRMHNHCLTQLIASWPADCWSCWMLALAARQAVLFAVRPDTANAIHTHLYSIMSGLPAWLLTVAASSDTAVRAVGSARLACSLCPCRVRARVLAAANLRLQVGRQRFRKESGAFPTREATACLRCPRSPGCTCPGACLPAQTINAHTRAH